MGPGVGFLCCLWEHFREKRNPRYKELKNYIFFKKANQSHETKCTGPQFGEIHSSRERPVNLLAIHFQNKTERKPVWNVTKAFRATELTSWTDWRTISAFLVRDWKNTLPVFMNKARLMLVCFRSTLKEAADHGHTAFSRLSWFDASSNLGLSSRPPHLRCPLKKNLAHPCLYSSGLYSFIASGEL